MLTIEGEGFGTDKGKIEFFDADALSFSASIVETSHSDITLWQDDMIQTIVPSADADGSFHTAGTGFFTVVLPGTQPATAQSMDVLRVDYSVHNFRTSDENNPESVPVYLVDSERGDGDADGQFTFTLSNNMIPYNDIRSIVEQSLCDWNAVSNINWELAPITSTTPSTAANNDNTNLIYFGQETEFTGASMDLTAYVVLTLSGDNRRTTCQVIGEPEPKVFQMEADIVFRQGNNLGDIYSDATGWFYENLSTPTGPTSSDELDFYSVLLHELGHVHLLRHTRETSKIMKRSRTELGATARNFSSEDINGARFTLSSSDEAFNTATCPTGLHEITKVALCGNPTSTSPKLLSSEVISYFVANDHLYFEWMNKNAEGNFRLIISTSNGKRVLTDEFKKVAGQERSMTPINRLADNQVYFFHLYEPNNSSFLSGKFILAQ